ncbi:hypothetical protein ACJW31_06G215900 [Castanea mollissima]
MAMASTSTWFSLTPLSTCLVQNNRAGATAKRFVSWSNEFCHPRLSWSYSVSVRPTSKARVSTVLSVVGEEKAGSEENVVNSLHDGVLVQGWKQPQSSSRPCELYVCNLPRSCDIAELLDIFNPFGTVLAVEISRNAVTGESRGCGYVTMSSINAAKIAMAALDASDVGGREMRVKFSVDMSPRMRNPEFGTLVSAKMLHDQKARTTRCYGFISFSSAAERDAALSLNGTEFFGRAIVVRASVERIKP